MTDKERRELLKKQYGILFESVSIALFEADPMGLNFESNTDEYEPEVGTILPRLAKSICVQDVEKIVYEEFCHWFSVKDAGPKETYGPVASKIWEIWLGHA
jgi:hypothetical protein